MEFIFAIIAIAIAISSENKKRKKRAAKQMQTILEIRAEQQGSTTVSTWNNNTGSGNSAFSQVKRQGTKAVFPSDDPGRVSAQQAKQSHPSQSQKTEYRSASGKDSPLMCKTVTKREKFERKSAYENSNWMDVRYTTSGCGCSTGVGNASSGKAHGFSSAMYDENRFFKESRKICSGNWS